MIFAGHNNPFIWIAKSADGLNWQSLGYVDGIETNQRPAVVKKRTTIGLAFRPVWSNQVAYGSLTIDDSNAPGTPGHIWQSSRDDNPAPRRVVSDLLLARRWPNGIVPYKFASNLGTPHTSSADYDELKDKVRAALMGTTSSALSTDCTPSTPCIGWAGAETIRFIECLDSDEHCGDYKYYVFIRISDYNKEHEGGDKYPNATYTKRGFSDLKSSTIKEDCDLLSKDDCRV
jgi:hypothetical protein